MPFYRISKKYKCYFHDCLEHPDYLVDVLKQVFGDGYISIVNNINKKLEEFSYQDQIKEFLLGLAGARRPKMLSPDFWVPESGHSVMISRNKNPWNSIKIFFGRLGLTGQEIILLKLSAP